MELRQLRYFVTVAETSHFGRAAERLHIAQPALSQSIRHLEAELGTSLFIRTTRQVALTPAGEYLLGEAHRLLETLDGSIRGVRRVAEGRKGQLRIGFTGTAGLSHLPRVAKALQRTLAGVVLEVVSDLLTVAQCDLLRAGKLDIAVLRPPVRGEGIAVRVIEREPLIVALPAGHSLAKREIVAIRQLCNQPFIGYAGKDSVVDAAVLRSCWASGFAPRVEHESSGTAVQLALVSGGLGVAVVPASARALPLAGVVFRDLADAEPVELALAWQQDTESPLVRKVLEALTGPL